MRTRYVSIELSVASQSNKYSKLACEGVQHDPRCADGLNCTVERVVGSRLVGRSGIRVIRSQGKQAVLLMCTLYRRMNLVRFGFDSTIGTLCWLSWYSAKVQAATHCVNDRVCSECWWVADYFSTRESLSLSISSAGEEDLSMHRHNDSADANISRGYQVKHHSSTANVITD